MRHYLKAVVLASALSMGVAQAAPVFGASSHRLGGGSEKAESRKPLSLFEAVLALAGIDLAASIEPIASDAVADRAGKTKECDQSKKTEVAKAETKETADGGSSKGRTRTGEPIYLAF